MFFFGFDCCFLTPFFAFFFWERQLPRWLRLVERFLNYQLDSRGFVVFAFLVCVFCYSIFFKLGGKL